jgi:hypothetical protein
VFWTGCRNATPTPTSVIIVTVSWLRYCATSREVVGSIPDEVIWFFNWNNTSSRTMALGSLYLLYPLDRRLGGPQSRSGLRGEKRNPFSLPRIEPRPSSPSLYSVLCYDWDTPVSTVSRILAQWLRNRSSVPGRGKTVFSLRHIVQTGSGAQPVSRVNVLS